MSTFNIESIDQGITRTIKKNKNAKLTIEEMQRIAYKQGGRCLSDSYMNNGTHLEWQCSEGHIWQARPRKVKQGTWCPSCARTVKLIVEKSILAEVKPGLVKEWHSTQNGTLTPYDVTSGSHTKIWWKCSKVQCQYEWQARVADRFIGNGCPACHGKVATVKNNLIVTSADLAKEWHSTQNGILTPYDVKTGSNKKVWWKCSKESCQHIWRAVIASRANGRGCPACAGQVATEKSNLAIANPNLTREWHPTQNGLLTPYDVRTGSSKKVWWKCLKESCQHEWRATIEKRSSGKGCPACSGRVATAKNNLVVVRAELALEWHQTKNGTLTPYDVKIGSDKKAWWKCSKEQCQYEWEASIYNRSRSSGCPKCMAGFGTSFPQLSLFYYLKQLFPKTEHKYIFNFPQRTEADIYIKELNFAIEYDGYPWHVGKEKSDETKSKDFSNNDIKLLRIRDERLPKLSETYASEEIVYINMRRNDSSIHEALSITFCFLKKSFHLNKKKLKELSSLNVNIKDHETLIRDQTQQLTIKKSIGSLYHFISREWHPTKNGNLTPFHVSAGSHKRVWWQCANEICKHEWQSVVKDRSSGKGCPACANKIVTEKNNLAVVKPQLIKEWHPTRNQTLTPYMVVPGSNLKAWWKCSKEYCHFEWQTIIFSRSRNTGCPACAGKVATEKNNLAVKNSKLTQEWHPTKNGLLTPFLIVPGSGKKAWWKCSENLCQYEWQATIRNRSKDKGCPVCAIKRKK